MAYIGSPAAPAIATVSDGTVTSAKLADDAVTSAKITDGAVTPTDLSTGHPNWDSSGNVGIGTSSPTTYGDGNTRFAVVSNTSGTADVNIRWGTNAVKGILYCNDVSGAGLGIGSTTNTYFGINTNNTERMRVDSSGNLLVNTTGTGSYLDGKIIAIASGTSPALTVKNLSTNQFVASFWNNGTTGNNIIQQFITETSPSVRGSITYNRSGGVIAFNTSSDYRLKENIVDLPNSLETISKLKPRQFDWKETGNTTTGFIAHELAEICPHAVNGDKDAVDSDGNPVYQGVDASKLVPLLTAALQEAITKIETLEARVATLESA